MITSDIRRILKWTLGCTDSEKMDKAVLEITSLFPTDYEFKYLVVSYCPLDNDEVDVILNTDDKEEALREYLIYKNKYMVVDDQDVKIVDNDNGREYVGGNWYE